MVSFEDFSKVELRVGQIVGCEPIEGSSRLYRLRVRLGEGERILAAGLAKRYSASELVGRKVAVVANLESKVILGIESQGMLLAADDGNGGVFLLDVDENAPVGSVIH